MYLVNRWRKLSTATLHILIVSSIVTFVFVLQFVFNSTALNRLDGLAYDTKLNTLPPLPKSQINIQIVDIDERSLFEIERMPWRRNLFADLTQKLADMGAIVIAYDILFSEPQPNPASPVLDLLAEHYEPTTNALPNNGILAQFDYDQQFAQALANKEVVLGTLLHRQQTLKKGVLTTQTIPFGDNQPTDRVTLYSGYAGVIEPLANRAVGLGYMNSVEDEDGIVRRASLIAKVDNGLVSALAVEAFRVYSLADTIEPAWQTNNDQRFLEGIKIGASLIPTDNHGQILIPFRGAAKTYPYTSAADILNNKVHQDEFAESVVFIGTSASGLADLRVTPVTVNMPGVEIQATLFESLLYPDLLIYQPDWWQGAVAVQLLLIAIIAFLIMPKLGPLLTALSAIILLGLIIIVNLALWRFAHIDLPIVSSLVLACALSIYFIGSGYFSEAKQRKQVKAIFDQYVPPAHIERLLVSPKSLNLEGEKKQLSVMFSDIRSFTTISESMTAHDLKRWLNRFFSPITKVIFDHDGTIDKYVGDMVMAFWGAPLDDRQHANKSIRASFAMLAALDKLNGEFKAQNLPLAHIGIGINTGEMNVGDMGSSYRRAYTVIGDAVNLGSRLEGLTKFYGLTLLVSEFTKEQANEFTFLLIDKVKVKGKLKPVTIYSPLPPHVSSTEQSYDDRYAKAITAYFATDFELALQLFESMREAFRYPILAKLYIERCQHFIHNPPPEDWDGSYTHTSK